MNHGDDEGVRGGQPQSLLGPLLLAPALLKVLVNEGQVVSLVVSPREV